MVTKINLKIEIIVHATEDYQKISDSLCDIFEIESSEITKKEFLGHFGNPILMLHIQMKNKRAEGVDQKTHFNYFAGRCERPIGRYG